MDKYKQNQSYWQKIPIFLRNFVLILTFSGINTTIYDRRKTGKEYRRGDTGIVRTGGRACTGTAAEMF